jgi:enoyl-CoA hydratase/carnithine racemase
MTVSESIPASDGAAQDTERPVLLEHLDDGISIITFNRPDKRNAMSGAARAAVVQALDECRSRSKVVILTGKGPAFCAGVDLKEAPVGVAEYDRSDTPGLRRTAWHAVQAEIRQHPAIVIAAVNGFALGGGVTLINTSDLAIAAEDAQLGLPEVTFGAYPGVAGPSTQLRTSMKRAAWLVLTADRVDGRTAAEWGLVNKAVPRADLLEETLRVARRIASFDATTLSWCKKALWQVPMNIADYQAALEYGISVNAEIQAQGSSDVGNKA